METPELSQRIGTMLRIARGGRPQLKVADAAGISDSALSNYERGEGIPSLPILVRLFEVLDISLAELIALFQDDTEPEPNGHEVAA